MGPRTRIFIAAVVALALGGCSIIASHNQYSSYRAVRLASDDHDRLIAAQQYVEHYPNGNWVERVQAVRNEHEDEVWQNGSSSREGLEWYLRVYPDGQYVQQARPRLAALQTVDTRREVEVEHQEELDAQRRAEAAEARRTWVTRAVQFWTHALLGIRNYGSTIQRVVGANPDFSRAFGQPPAPTCTAEFCIKHYGQLYHIPVPGATRIDRHMDVYLRLRLSRGRVERAELVLPNKGFSRWYEMENRTVVTDEDPEQRNTALNWALDRIQPVIEELAPNAQRIDYIPEPLDVLQVRGESSNTDQAPTSPDAAAPAAESDATAPAAESSQKKQDGESIDDLLDEAVGGDEAQPQQEAQPEEAAPPEATETMVLPVGMMAWQVRNLRVVVFAAAPDDYDQAYDGIFIERIRD